jgi:hypothetical protein
MCAAPCFLANFYPANSAPECQTMKKDDRFALMLQEQLFCNFVCIAGQGNAKKLKQHIYSISKTKTI